MTMDDSSRTILQRYYNTASSDYGEFIEDAFAPLATKLVEAANPAKGVKVLDLGCGTGLIERALRGRVQNVVGVDFSFNMLWIAQRKETNRLINGDLHNLPFNPRSFDMVMSNFAFNHTDPVRAFAEAYRVLTPNGCLWFQEWGERDKLSALLSDIFVEYMIDEPTPELDRFRDQMVMDLPWDELETTEDIHDLLGEIGFVDSECMTLKVDIRFDSTKQFLNYKLAWPARKAELMAMPQEVRMLCLTDLEENFGVLTEADGTLIWSPEIYRFSTWKG